MAYVTAITDRTQADIGAQNSKAFFNLADWQRIDNNARWVADLVNTTFGRVVWLGVAPIMTTTSIPTPSDVNILAGNIEIIRAWLDANFTITDPEFTTVKDDYVSGTNLTYAGYAYPFQVVNHWEKVLDIAYNYVSSLVTRDYAITGVAISGADDIRNYLIRG